MTIIIKTRRACSMLQPAVALLTYHDVMLLLLLPCVHAAPPRVWGYKQCMEIDSQFFWSGAPWDMVGAQAAAACESQRAYKNRALVNRAISSHPDDSSAV
jgi:hypothetical protein